MAVAKRKNKSRKPESAANALDEIEEKGADLTEWISDNPIPILATGAAVLLVAAGISLTTTSMRQSQDEGSAAVAAARMDYRLAMGAPPDAVEITEPANPETARQARSKFVVRFHEVGEEYSGNPAGQLALLEAGHLEEELGNFDEAIATWQSALEGLGDQLPLRAIIQTRIAATHESLGRFAEAAASYQAASEIRDYPLRYMALVDAARCLSESGDAAGALALYERLQQESPELALSEHTEAQLREIQASLAPKP